MISDFLAVEMVGCAHRMVAEFWYVEILMHVRDGRRSCGSSVARALPVLRERKTEKRDVADTRRAPSAHTSVSLTHTDITVRSSTCHPHERPVLHFVSTSCVCGFACPLATRRNKVATVAFRPGLSLKSCQSAVPYPIQQIRHKSQWCNMTMKMRMTAMQIQEVKRKHLHRPWIKLLLRVSPTMTKKKHRYQYRDGCKILHPKTKRQA